MSRLVKGRNSAEAVFANASEPEPLRDRLDRVAKYIPGETLAAYIGLNGMVATLTEHQSLLIGYGAAFLVGLIFTPFYFAQKAEEGDAKRAHQFISTAAFAIYAYALHSGLFTESGFYHPVIATFLVVVFTLYTGIAKRPLADTTQKKGSASA